MKHKRLSKKIVRIFAIKNPLPRVRTGEDNIPQLNASSEIPLCTKLGAVVRIIICSDEAQLGINTNVVSGLNVSANLA